MRTKKMSRKKSDTIWVVVSVESGVPVLVEAYRDEKIAKLRRRLLRRKINPDYDEVGAFAVEIGKRDSDC
jgi:hypothetical protein